ncbi:MAG: DUF6328 family protein, partial [Nitrososphaerales archaeon]
SGILFGFLLNVSSFRRIEAPEEQMILVLALSSAAVSVVTFLLPVIYHHSHSFPITKEEANKIYFRSHRFALWGLIALITTIYFSLILALYAQLGIWSYLVATLILTVPAILFMMRKVQIPPGRRNQK